MGAIENAKAYGLTIRESADDGSDFTNPDADYRRLFLGEDGQLHVKDSSGTVTGIGGAVADILDIPTAEDDDTLVLAPDGVGGVEFRAEAGGGLDSGASFPGSPSAGDLFFHTTRGMLFYYDGTRWLTTHEYSGQGPGDALINSNGALTTVLEMPVGPGDIFVTSLEATVYVVTTNDGSKYWTLTVNKVSTANANTSLGAFTTAAHSASTWTPVSVAINEVVVRANFPSIRVNTAKTSTPGNLYFALNIRYRLIGT